MYRYHFAGMQWLIKKLEVCFKTKSLHLNFLLILYIKLAFLKALTFTDAMMIN